MAKLIIPQSRINIVIEARVYLDLVTDRWNLEYTTDYGPDKGTYIVYDAFELRNVTPTVLDVNFKWDGVETGDYVTLDDCGDNDLMMPLIARTAAAYFETCF